MPSWWDRFGQEWAAQGLTDDPTFAQADAGWAFIGQAPPTVEQFNSMFQWGDDKDNWLYGQIANCIIGSGTVPSSNDLTQLWTAIKSLQRRKLDQDTAFYVDAINGNDISGTGILGNPWKTIQHAINYIYTYVDLSGRMAIIQLAPGTYEPFTHSQTVNGYLVVQGDPLNSRAYIIKNTLGGAVYCVAASVLYIQGVSLEGAGTLNVGDDPYTNYGIGLFADRGGLIIYDSLSFGPCGEAHMQVGTLGYLYPWRGSATVYTIYGPAKSHLNCIVYGLSTLAAINITIQNNPTFPSQFFLCSSGGIINIDRTVFHGTFIGQKYNVWFSGILLGGLETQIPGTIDGWVDSASYGLIN
jgi:hypothetical protein